MTDTESFRDALRGRLLGVGLVSRVDNFRNDLAIEVGDNNNKYNVYVLLLMDSVVFHVDLRLPTPQNLVEVFKFLNVINRQIPFGNFFVTESGDIAFKVFLLSGSLKSDEDLSFCIYWIFDIVSTYKTALEIAVSPIENAHQMAERLLEGVRDTLRSSSDTDSEE